MSKTGFIYITMETDRYQDTKIKRLKKTFSGNGVAVHDYIQNEIYRVRGCFMEWDESTVFDVAEYWGLKETLVEEIVTYCGHVGLFNKELLTGESVITSPAIQRRFLDWSSKMKRLNVKIPEKYDLITEKTPKVLEVLPIVLEEIDVKKSNSKEKKSEVKVIGFTPDTDFDNLILSFWGIGEITHFKNFKKFRDCCALQFTNGLFEHFKTQCADYVIYTDLIGVKYKHSFERFLGSQEAGFDGIWNSENWALKIKDEHSKNPNQKQKLKFPDVWDAIFDASLFGFKKEQYWYHLQQLGWSVKPNPAGYPVWRRPLEAQSTDLVKNLANKLKIA